MYQELYKKAKDEYETILQEYLSILRDYQSDSSNKEAKASLEQLIPKLRKSSQECGRLADLITFSSI